MPELNWRVVNEASRMTSVEHAEFTTCYHHLTEVLKKATSNEPRDFTEEVTAVFVAACKWAVKYHQTEPKMGHVVDADSMAAGHVDWCTKFPLYVAELVYDVSNWAR